MPPHAARALGRMVLVATVTGLEDVPTVGGGTGAFALSHGDTLALASPLVKGP